MYSSKAKQISEIYVIYVMNKLYLNFNEIDSEFQTHDLTLPRFPYIVL